MGISIFLMVIILWALFLAAAFHLCMGGPAEMLLIYILLSSAGILLGHFLASWLGIDLIVLGSFHFLAGTATGFLFLLFGWWLSKS